MFSLGCISQMADGKKGKVYPACASHRKRMLRLPPSRYFLHPLIQLCTTSLNKSPIGAVYKRRVHLQHFKFHFQGGKYLSIIRQE